MAETDQLLPVVGSPVELSSSSSSILSSLMVLDNVYGLSMSYPSRNDILLLGVVVVVPLVLPLFVPCEILKRKKVSMKKEYEHALKKYTAN